MTDAAYERLTNKITLSEFNGLFSMLCREHATYDVAIEHVLRVDRGFVVVYALITKPIHKPRTSPINHQYQRCAFVTFTQAGECYKCSDIALG